MASPLALGIDFGTTNSAIAYLQPNGTVGMVPFADGELTSRSVLFALQHRTRPGRPVNIWTGGAAIEQYLATGDDPDLEASRRFIQSLKSHLTARELTGTEIFGRQYRFEDLVARILTDLRTQASQHLGYEVTTALVGRPVQFVGAQQSADNDFAEQRLRASLEQAGFQDVRFAMEPIAAAYAAEQHTPQDGLLLIGDFGGGTTDFSLLRIRSGQREVLGSTGLGIAGDAFDAKIVRYLIAPALGSESMARELGKTLPALPAWVYANLERWHTLSFLKTHAVTNLLRNTQRRAMEPEKIQALSAVIDHDLGFLLHRSVRQLKTDLTEQDTAEFVLDTEAVQLRQTVQRSTFESWIAPELSRMEAALEELLTQTGMPASAVDRVFLTGGTSLVPAVRRLFTTRFQEDRVRSGGVLTSVAHGLALMAAER
ncbi:MAG: Hsp70 family protein [Micavibrio sp.]|nr:Hsp70 family protein [Micavibrio sp.]